MLLYMYSNNKGLFFILFYSILFYPCINVTSVLVNVGKI